MAAVEFKQVDVIFGNDPAAALKLLDGGEDRAAILEATGSVLGVHDANGLRTAHVAQNAAETGGRERGHDADERAEAERQRRVRAYDDETSERDRVRDVQHEIHLSLVLDLVRKPRPEVKRRDGRDHRER